MLTTPHVPRYRCNYMHVPVVLGGKPLRHRGRLSESLDRLDPANGSDDDPIMADIRAQIKERANARLKKG